LKEDFQTGTGDVLSDS